LLIDEQLPEIAALTGDKSAALTQIYHRLYAPNHPVRALIHFLSTIETIRIIEEKSRKS